jgi:hypothetical protein
MDGASFERRDQDTPTVDGGWNGNFQPGDGLLWTDNIPNPPIPIKILTISFNIPVLAAVLQIQADDTGAFTAQIEAFNGSTSLGVDSENGTSNANADGSAIFIGLQNSVRNISSIQISLTAAAFGDLDNFAINQVSLIAGENQATVPEPSTFAVSSMLLGMFGLVGLRKRVLRSAMPV